MWVAREPVRGGFRYNVFVNDATTHVSYLGTNFLYNVGWHPLDSPFVSADDDAILRARGLIREEAVRIAADTAETSDAATPVVDADF